MSFGASLCVKNAVRADSRARKSVVAKCSAPRGAGNAKLSVVRGSSVKNAARDVKDAPSPCGAGTQAGAPQIKLNYTRTLATTAR